MKDFLFSINCALPLISGKMISFVMGCSVVRILFDLIQAFNKGGVSVSPSSMPPILVNYNIYFLSPLLINYNLPLYKTNNFIPKKKIFVLFLM